MISEIFASNISVATGLGYGDVVYAEHAPYDSTCILVKCGAPSPILDQGDEVQACNMQILVTGFEISNGERLAWDSIHAVKAVFGGTDSGGREYAVLGLNILNYPVHFIHEGKDNWTVNFQCMFALK